MKLPTLAVRSLAGRNLKLPRDLPARRTAVIVAFDKHHQPDVDAWIAPLVQAGVPVTPRGLPADAELAVVEIPMIKRRYSPARGLIDGGMATTIGDPDINARTWTIYTDVDRFLRSIGIAGDSTIVVLVVEQDGTITEMQRDRPDPEKLARITAALGL